ncbi:hypothetical protein OG530_06280 [Streptomyces decoyicus]|uniref:hypothetical protein n=1 Tax=Streptomyces decoyicus TaxID=249567 RepID=UPI002E192EA0
MAVREARKERPAVGGRGRSEVPRRGGRRQVTQGLVVRLPGIALGGGVDSGERVVLGVAGEGGAPAGVRALLISARPVSCAASSGTDSRNMPPVEWPTLTTSSNACVASVRTPGQWS